MPKVVLLIESILGERSRTVARIKRENFHRGVSCLEPLAAAGGVVGAGGGGGGGGGGAGGPDPPVRGVSWDETVKVKERPQSSVETREETDKLREMISIRRGSTQLETAGRPLLTRGSSVTTQHVLKTSERPPLARGFSCQTRRNNYNNNYNYPTITLSRPTTSGRPQTMLEEPKIDLLSAVSEIHDNLKENTAPALTEEETEDEFHEELQGGSLLLLLHLLPGDLEMRAATNP